MIHSSGIKRVLKLLDCTLKVSREYSYCIIKYSYCHFNIYLVDIFRILRILYGFGLSSQLPLMLIVIPCMYPKTEFQLWPTPLFKWESNVTHHMNIYNHLYPEVAAAISQWHRSVQRQQGYVFFFFLEVSMFFEVCILSSPAPQYLTFS